MNYFVNEYRNTDETIAECVTAQVRRRSVVLYIAIGYNILWALYMIAMDIYFGAFSIYTVLSSYELTTITVTALLIWLCIRREKRAVRMQQERSRVFFKDAIPVYRIEIGEDIHMTTLGSERNLSFSDVRKLIETKNLMILLVRGNLAVSLDKRGFVQGDTDECRQYLKEKIRQYGGKR